MGFSLWKNPWSLSLFCKSFNFLGFLFKLGQFLVFFVLRLSWLLRIFSLRAKILGQVCLIFLQYSIQDYVHPDNQTFHRFSGL